MGPADVARGDRKVPASFSSLKSTPVQAQRNIPLAPFTTWRVGGLAEWLVEPNNEEELRHQVDWARRQGLPCRVIGAGSNLLISDTGLPGLTICLRRLQGCCLDVGNGTIMAWAGELLPILARRAARCGLHGLEWSVGIPGTVGGAVVMNAGAQGSCTAERLIAVRVLPLEGGDPFEIPVTGLDYAYRYSRLQQECLIVTAMRLQLEPGYDPLHLGQVISASLRRRIATQPYQRLSCGSVFRNPEPLKAGRLIEDAGLKGCRIGGAEVSTLHANFITNSHGASAADIDSLIRLVRSCVWQRHAVNLHTEIKRLGFERS